MANRSLIALRALIHFPAMLAVAGVIAAVCVPKPANHYLFFGLMIAGALLHVIIEQIDFSPLYPASARTKASGPLTNKEKIDLIEKAARKACNEITSVASASADVNDLVDICTGAVFKLQISFHKTLHDLDPDYADHFEQDIRKSFAAMHESHQRAGSASVADPSR